jgi:hypothetical protein
MICFAVSHLFNGKTRNLYVDIRVKTLTDQSLLYTIAWVRSTHLWFDARRSTYDDFCDQMESKRRWLAVVQMPSSAPRPNIHRIAMWTLDAVVIPCEKRPVLLSAPGQKILDATANEGRLCYQSS